ncbi:MAG: bifunctional DNA-formamidopyrimidine glycosylase/DNA-(apurinic or apyrimidinic site) lyase [Candidatus Lernaella stagnicola]|nr:bifunctional DNA-formamidopyrimidine glycosylase/DNA-(apurinic or apyrimidinic site) lyase [Candidatus Lernaella stagnicola]
MPEMPEVETLVRSLRSRLVGRRIRRVDVYDEKLDALDPQPLRGRTIHAAFRSGKEIVLDLSTPRRPLWLCVHLRMTGKLLYTDGAVALPEKHLRASFYLDAGELRFYDSRRFGRIRLAHTQADFAPPGVEILSDEFTWQRVQELIGNSRSPIKVWLLRQDRIVGFGNIYAAEVCFAARLDPRRPAASLSVSEIKALHRVTRRIFTDAIACGGTTISDFMDCEGRCGEYRHRLNVYGREGERCRRRGCVGEIKRIAQAGRSTFFCPTCQR